MVSRKCRSGDELRVVTNSSLQPPPLYHPLSQSAVHFLKRLIRGSNGLTCQVLGGEPHLPYLAKSPCISGAALLRIASEAASARIPGTIPHVVQCSLQAFTIMLVNRALQCMA